MSKIVDVKQASVSFLELLPFDAHTGVGQDVYNDAIVNIFTRLNTAGRALTRQEITFAWIKNGWGAGNTADNRTAGQCFEDLKAALAEEQVAVDTDALVGAVSTMWSVINRDGALLQANDLLRGEKVRPMAQDLVKSWDAITRNALDGARLVRENGFEYGTHYRSLNVLTLLLTWRLIAWKWAEERRISVTGRDGFEKALNALFAAKCDRWILMSQWSGRWGKSTDRTLAEYAKDLSEDWKKIKELESPEQVITTLEERVNAWLAALQTESAKHIDNLSALDRNRVQDYFLPLWVWHRLDPARWKASRITLRTGGRKPKLEVDHVVAVKLWENLPRETADGENVQTTMDLPENPTSINAIGNCCLLEKSFNISKGAKPLAEFLAKIHEFRTGSVNLDSWTANLGLHSELVDPSNLPANRIHELIDRRSNQIKSELKGYLSGEKHLVAWR